jgi:hypothetical protein
MASLMLPFSNKLTLIGFDPNIELRDCKTLQLVQTNPLQGNFIFQEFHVGAQRQIKPC